MFDLGRLVLTHFINDEIADNTEFSREIVKIMKRYRGKDWGDLSKHDKEINEEALKIGDRLLATYETTQGKVYVITEADRSITTILFSHEY